MLQFRNLVQLLSSVALLGIASMSIWGRRSKRRMFVIGSGYGDFADPNATSMAKFLIEKGYDVIWLAPRDDAPDGVTLRRRGSFQAARDFLKSNGGFYTHSFSDIIPQAHRLGFLAKRFRLPTLIFVQHGVIGLKSELSNGILLSRYIKSLEPTFSKIIVSSVFEKELVAGMGVPTEKVAITGLPRFDSYTVNRSSKLCLVFFTWQNARSYYEKLRQVHALPSIQDLKSQGFSVESYHHHMQAAKETLKPRGAYNLDRSVAECSLLITDDSSLAWDVLYRGAEVLFYRASDKWLTRSPEILERRFADVTGLDEAISNFLGGHRNRKVTFSAYNDDNNCQRVFDLLELGTE